MSGEGHSVTTNITKEGALKSIRVPSLVMLWLTFAGGKFKPNFPPFRTPDRRRFTVYDGLEGPDRHLRNALLILESPN